MFNNRPSDSLYILWGEICVLDVFRFPYMKKKENKGFFNKIKHSFLPFLEGELSVSRYFL